MTVVADIKNLKRADKVELAMLLAERERRESRRKLFSFYPETGMLSRHAYPKHMQFFSSGALYRERAAMAANRVGKTEGMGGYELTLHLTGEYPAWWKGRRFEHPIEAWASGTTRQTTRDILQAKMCGKPGIPSDQGCGLIPGDAILGVSQKPGVPDGIETVKIKHKSGGVSLLTFKSYDQGRKAFEGTKKDVILLDEEPDEGIYSECLIRTADTDGRGSGILMLTFTPLMGLSAVVLMFMPQGKAPEGGIAGNRFMVSATWDDAPHLSEKEKRDLEESIPMYQRQARTKGVPQLGSGAIYPADEKEITVKDFIPPREWPRMFAFDPGWNRTAVLWAAWDRESDIVYLYSEHYASETQPAVHANSVQARGKWIPGVIDPAARGRAQKDGEQLISTYRDLGLKLEPALNSVEAGIVDVWLRLSTGRLKVFASLQHWFEEFRIYRRDEKGKIVKENDHLMDCMRYIILNLSKAMVKAYEDVKVSNMTFSGRF